MAKIQELSPHIANLIAAGEVVDRPGSVVKELVENSIDSGASSVIIEIQNGGMSYIRVTDNGCGIAPEDVRTAFLRHATSKLRTEKDLEAINTLGFRGEALAAICAVSHIDLLSRERGSVEGSAISLSGGVPLDQTVSGCPEGTTIIVRDLFFNTPARLKFIKKDSAEAANITSIVIRMAMSHPEISFQYIKNGKEEFFTSGDGRLDSCIYSLFGKDFFSALLPVEHEADGIRVFGYVTTPAAVRGNRSNQFFFLNGRSIRSAVLQTAFEQAYKNRIPVGRFPSCVLHLQMRSSSVDVNVHPAKIDVKFTHDRVVFNCVYSAVYLALNSQDGTQELPIEKSAKQSDASSDQTSKSSASEAVPFLSQNPAIDMFKLSVPEQNEAQALRSNIFPNYSFTDYMPSFDAAKSKETENGAEQTSEKALPAEEAPPFEESAQPGETKSEAEESFPALVDAPLTLASGSSEPADNNNSVSDYSIIGEIFHSYILVESGEELIIIDKHAAHERMIFDSMKNDPSSSSSSAQVLLEPIVVSLSPEDSAVFSANINLFWEIGFDASDFGSNFIILRQVPCCINEEDIPAMLTELCEELRNGKRLSPSDTKDKIISSLACKAAIKAGWKNDVKEFIPIVEQVLSGKVLYCPHGRPVSLRISKSSMDKNFKRT